MWADAFNDVFGLFHLETRGKGDAGNVDILKAVGTVATAAGEVDMAMTVAGVVQVADAVLLRTGAVVNLMQQVGLGEQGQRAEQCGTVDGGQGGLQVCQAEGIGEAMTHLAPNEQADSRQPDARIVQYLLIGNVYVHIS